VWDGWILTVHGMVHRTGSGSSDRGCSGSVWCIRTTERLGAWALTRGSLDATYSPSLQRSMALQSRVCLPAIEIISEPIIIIDQSRRRRLMERLIERGRTGMLEMTTVRSASMSRSARSESTRRRPSCATRGTAAAPSNDSLTLDDHRRLSIADLCSTDGTFVKLASACCCGGGAWGSGSRVRSPSSTAAVATVRRLAMRHAAMCDACACACEPQRSRRCVGDGAVCSSRRLVVASSLALLLVLLLLGSIFVSRVLSSWSQPTRLEQRQERERERDAVVMLLFLRGGLGTRTSMNGWS